MAQTTTNLGGEVMDRFIMLTKDEAQAILKELSAHQLATIFNKEHLLSALAKLDGDGEHRYYPATGGSAFEEEPEHNWSMFGERVMLIKTVRTLGGFGLKEALDFVTARLGANLHGTPGIHFYPSQLGLNGSPNYEFRKAQEICDANHVSLRTR
jgi:hypothetical protein